MTCLHLFEILRPPLGRARPLQQPLQAEGRPAGGAKGTEDHKVNKFKKDKSSFISCVPLQGACGTRAWRSRGRSVETKWRSATVTFLIEHSRLKIVKIFKNTLSQATSSGPCARTARRTRSPAASTRGRRTGPPPTIQQLRRPRRRLRRHWPMSQ